MGREAEREGAWRNLFANSVNASFSVGKYQITLTALQTAINGLQSVAVSARLPWLEVEALEGLDLNLDGEPMESTGLRFRAEPGALRLHLPKHSSLLAGQVHRAKA